MPFTGSTPQCFAACGDLSISHAYRRLILLAIGIAFAPCLSHADDHNDIQIARYTTVSSAPTSSQIDPLEAIVQVNFPRTLVRSVGDATTYLLLRTGYHLAPTEQLDEQVKNVLALPLPEVHRNIGPYSVRNALSVLLGSAFSLYVDSIRREISYHLESNSEKAVQTPNEKRQKVISSASAPVNTNFQVATLGEKND